MGRPKSTNPKCKQYRIRLTNDEHESLKRTADDLGIKVSQLIRNLIFGGEIAGKETDDA